MQDIIHVNKLRIAPDTWLKFNARLTSAFLVIQKMLIVNEPSWPMQGIDAILGPAFLRRLLGSSHFPLPKKIPVQNIAKVIKRP